MHRALLGVALGQAKVDKASIRRGASWGSPLTAAGSAQRDVLVASTDHYTLGAPAPQDAQEAALADDRGSESISCTLFLPDGLLGR